MPGAVLGQGSSLKKENKMSALQVVANKSKEKADSGCESDSDSNYACEAPDFDEEVGRACSRPSGKQNYSTGLYSGKTDAGSSRFDNVVSLDSAGRPCKKRKTESLNPVNASTVNLTASKPCSATTLPNSSLVSQESKNNSVDSGSLDVCCDVHKADGEEAAHVEDNEKVTPSCSQDSIQPAGSVAGPQAKKLTIWIVGHSFIKLAQVQACHRYVGAMFGFNDRLFNIVWKGKEGMRWKELLPCLNKWMVQGRCPDVLLIHLGENDLCEEKGVVLMRAMKKDLVRLKEQWAACHVLWTELVPRRVWTGALNPKAIDRARRKVNLEISRFCRHLGFGRVMHKELRFEAVEFFRDDGVHLSRIGMDLYLLEIREVLARCLKVQAHSD
ncbi:uncharacterized protein LOC144817736 isoform X4 [Lissotriton helveticus]